MKTIFKTLGLALILGSTTTLAQSEFKSFRVGLGGGPIVPPGFLLYVEPSLRLHDNYSLGFRVETAARFHADVSILGSYTINGQYYFYSQDEARFFAGLGFGAYTVNRGPLGYCSCEGQLKDNTVVGFYPRLGFEQKHFVITLDYNIVQSTRQVIQNDYPIMMNSTNLPTYYQASTSYFSFKLGWFIGGGRKKKVH